ncbi:MAG: TVP38/TMEM64 family protein [Thermoguttaceae bacterium]|jgi:uncharacterized membrane protein YdjX (TVP38/TMEM64 family)
MKLAVAFRIGFAALLLAAIVATLFFLPVQRDIEWVLEWIRALGPWGLVLFVAFYVIVCLLFLPGSALTLAGGFMFGTAKGIAAASLGATLGAAAAFLISRAIGRQWLERRLMTHPRFFAVDRAIGREGFKIVLLTRLCSLFPYDLMSYVFGLTKVSLHRYVVATWLGRLPEIVVWAYLGSNAKNLSDLVAGKIDAGIGKQILLCLGLASMLAVAVILAEIARRALHEAVNAPHEKE